jgi:hypothetical protein
MTLQQRIGYITEGENMRTLTILLCLSVLGTACTPTDPVPTFIFLGINDGPISTTAQTVTQSPLRLKGIVTFAGSTGVEFFRNGQSLGVETSGISEAGNFVFTREIPLTKTDNGQYTFKAFAQNTAAESAVKYYTSKEITVTVALP